MNHVGRWMSETDPECSLNLCRRWMSISWSESGKDIGMECTWLDLKLFDSFFMLRADLIDDRILKGKGIRFIVLYPPKRSHNLPPLAGTVHTETISIPRGIFQSNWQHIAHTL